MVYFVFFFSDGRLKENDQILAINNQILDTSISHNHAIQILQQARGPVNLVVARDVTPSPPSSTAPPPPDSPPPADVEGSKVTDGLEGERVKEEARDEQGKSPLRSESSTEMVVSLKHCICLIFVFQKSVCILPFSLFTL